MTFDSDVALLGTGIASLVAANHLLVQGKSVLLLNPDRDFFLEDSELPLDPMLLKMPSPQRIARSSPEFALEQLRPDFPGAIELWSPEMEIGKEGFHDPSAPHVRKRKRLWVSSPDKNKLWNWEDLEDLYVETSDAGLDPLISEGLSAIKRFPGFSSNAGNFRSLSLPKICDVDISRYRNGLLEFVRERMGTEKVVCAVNQLEYMPDGIRFYANGSPHTARLKDGMLVFWTPRLSSWILNQTRKIEASPKVPSGIRFWEQWSINSREAPDPGIVGMFGDMAVWADFEGTPSFGPRALNEKELRNQKLPCLAVLRSGPLRLFSDINLQQASSWASAESFGALSNLCHGFLRWDRFSVRSLRVRALFEWQKHGTDLQKDEREEQPWMLSKEDPRTWIVPGSDGPLVDVVRTARAACGFL
jgi:hypothetical protein